MRDAGKIRGVMYSGLILSPSMENVNKWTGLIQSCEIEITN